MNDKPLAQIWASHLRGSARKAAQLSVVLRAENRLALAQHATNSNWLWSSRQSSVIAGVALCFTFGRGFFGPNGGLNGFSRPG